MALAPRTNAARPVMSAAGWTDCKEPVAEGALWRLRPASATVATAVIMGIFAAVWNGITWTGIISIWRSNQGLIAIGFTLFLAIFALIGLITIIIFGYLLLKALFTPRVELLLRTPALTAGQTHDLQWEVTKARQRLGTLEICLVLREEVQYRRGTDTTTERHEISSHQLLSLSEPAASGRCSVTLPVELLPSFTTTSNQLLWSLRVRGVVQGFPDVDDDYPVRVLPATPVTATLTGEPLPDDSALAGETSILALADPGTPLTPGHPRVVVTGATKPSVLQLRWATSGKGDAATEIAARLDLPAGCSAAVLVLPATPPAWNGTLVSLVWRLELLVAGSAVRTETLQVVTPVSRLDA